MVDNENDFGFSFMSEDILKPKQDLTKLYKLRDMIMPLLLNLKKNPDKDLISWPGQHRIASIDTFIQQMNDLIDE